jgi:hypothetical protein
MMPLVARNPNVAMPPVNPSPGVADGPIVWERRWVQSIRIWVQRIGIIDDPLHAGILSPIKVVSERVERIAGKELVIAKRFHGLGGAIPRRRCPMRGGITGRRLRLGLRVALLLACEGVIRLPAGAIGRAIEESPLSIHLRFIIASMAADRWLTRFSTQ